ncbi:hypothetical protein [Undibacterium sp. WLX3042]|uniref:hypothetical protein n=1 Tax=Undibacterium sp. WLX3042 TaxID=3412686 RepID=UPI003C303C2F
MKAKLWQQEFVIPHVRRVQNRQPSQYWYVSANAANIRLEKKHENSPKISTFRGVSGDFAFMSL